MALGKFIGAMLPITLIASMESLISYRYYANIDKADTKKYIGVFTVANVVFLGVLLVTEPMIG